MIVPHAVRPIVFGDVTSHKVSFSLASKAGSGVCLFLYFIFIYHLCNPHLMDKNHQQ